MLVQGWPNWPVTTRRASALFLDHLHQGNVEVGGGPRLGEPSDIARSERYHEVNVAITAGAGSAMIFMITCCAELPMCGGSPVSISYSTLARE